MSDKIIVYTQGWGADGDVEPGEEPQAQLHSRVVINGHEIPSIGKVTVVAKGGDFAVVTLEATVQSIQFVPLARDDWKQPDLSGFEPEST